MERADATAMPSRPLDTLVETDRKGMAFCQPHPPAFQAEDEDVEGRHGDNQRIGFVVTRVADEADRAKGHQTDHEDRECDQQAT